MDQSSNYTLDAEPEVNINEDANKYAQTQSAAIPYVNSRDYVDASENDAEATAALLLKEEIRQLKFQVSPSFIH